LSDALPLWLYAKLIPEMSNHRIAQAISTVSTHDMGRAVRRSFIRRGAKHHSCLN